MSLAASIPSMNEHTCFVVFKLNSTANKNTAVGGVHFAFAYWLAAQQGMDSQGDVYVGGGTDTLDTNGITRAQDSRGLVLLLVYGYCSGWMGRVTRQSSTAQPETPFPRQTCFYNANNGGEWFQGEVVVIGYYNRFLTSSEILSVEGSITLIPATITQCQVCVIT